MELNRELGSTKRLTSRTREVLAERVARPAKIAPDFFTKEEFATLKALTEVLIPKRGDWRVDVAGMIDTRLHEGDGKGWRFDELPPEGEMYRSALRTLHARGVCELAPEARSAMIESELAEGERQFEGFFEELLVDVVQGYYSHPYSQLAIGADGFADLGEDA